MLLCDRYSIEALIDETINIMFGALVVTVLLPRKFIYEKIESFDIISLSLTR